MTIAVGQKVITQSPTSGSATSGAINTTTGSTFVVYTVSFPSAGTLTCADNKGNTYTQINTQTAPSPQPVVVAAFIKENGNGGSGHTFTITNASGNNFLIIAVEVTGGAVGILDTHPAANNDAASPYTSTSTGTLAQAVELALAFQTDDRGGTTNAATWGGGFTLLLDAPDSTNVTGSVATQLTAATTALVSSLTIAASSIAETWVITLKDGGATAPSVGALKSPGPGISPDYTQLFRSRQLGFTAASANVTVALTGSTATFTAGTLKANTDKAITGQTGTFAAGTLAPSTTVPLVGATATFTPGTFSASTGGDVTVALTGQTATFAAGTLSPAIDKGLTGSTATFAAGTLAPSIAVALTGSIATFAAGTFGAQVTGDVTVALTGITATFTAGTFTASGGDAPASTFGDGVPRGGVPYKRAKTLKEKPNKHLKKILEDVESVYREIINGPDVPAAVAQIVAPFTESLKALPPAAEIDWDALEDDAGKVSQLLRAWSEQQRKAQSDADDEWFLLSD